MRRLSMHLVLVVSISILSGCGKLKKLLHLGDNGGTLKCNISLANPIVIVPEGQLTQINVSLDGGSSPYSFNITGPQIVADPSFSISYNFSNKKDYAVTEDLVFKIGDSAGNEAMCELKTTVAANGQTGGGTGTNPTPTPTPGSNLMCNVQILDESPEVDHNIHVLATASNGTGAYTFSNLMLGGDTSGQIVSPLSAVGDTQAAGMVKFGNAGSKSVSVMVTDGNGGNTTCSKTFSVRKPSIVVTSNPTNGTTATGNSITLTAAIAGFATPYAAYDFTTTEPGVSITKNGNVATVNATDGGAHSFTLTVTATDAAMADVATTNVSLVFTSVQTGLTCTVNVAARNGSFYPVIPFTYYYYSVSPDVPASAGATGVKITSLSSSPYGYTSYARDARTQNVTYINSSPLVAAQVSVKIAIFISDDQGRKTSCTTTQTVWAY